jgi:hypothetical protein
MTLPEPATVAERTGYRETSRHADVLRFIEELRRRRTGFRVESMGTSGLGQEMPVLVFGERPGRPVVLVLANIHAGEVEGKEALLALARDLAEPLFDRLTLFLVPNYNPDGNDRIDVRNRALDLGKLEGQIGPEGGVGTRYTGQGINLNRDYMKLEAVESRNLSRLYGRIRPHLTIDCHTTDGSIHGFALTFDTSHIPTAPCEYVRRRMLPDVRRRLAARTGLETFFYGNFVDEKDLSRGWATYPHFPRYGSHYRGLTGRMDVLLESYSYIPFRDRVVVTTEILRELFDDVASHADEVLGLCAEAERWRPDPVAIAYGPPQAEGDCEILAWDLESQLARRIPGRERRSYRMPHLCRFVPSKTVPRPAAYVVRRDQEAALRKLLEHNLRVERLEEAATVEAETYRVASLRRVESPDAGSAPREETAVEARLETVYAALEAGDALVRTDQPLGTLAAYLLEPESDDGLARWGVFEGALREAHVYPVIRIPGGRRIELPRSTPY